MSGLVKAEYEKSYAAGTPLQPYMIAYRQTEGKLGPFFVVIDGRIIDIGFSAVMALDILFKSHYVFNLHYEWAFEAVFKYFEHYVYQIPGRPEEKDPKKPNAKPNNPPASLLALHVKVEKVVL